MKKLFILACVLALAAPAFAGQAKVVKAKHDGVIEKFDAATHTLTVKKKDKQGEFVVNDASEITNNGAKADVSALVSGSKVDVEFSMDGAKKIVHKAKVSGAATKK